MSKVTVWLTSYNHEPFIKESIESILRQTYKDFILYIVDDCSDDNSWNIIQSYKEKDNRIVTIRHDENKGSSQINLFFNDLPGEYVAIAHSDDVWELDKLEKQMAYLESHKNLAACFTLVTLINDWGEDISLEKDRINIFEQPNRSRFEWLNYFFYNRNCLCHPSVVLNKKICKECGIFPKGLHGYPDFYQWIRICKYADIYIIQEKLTKFRIHENEKNTSGRSPENIRRIYTEEFFLLKQYKDLIDNGDLEKVFPETSKFKIDGYVMEEFALAQMYLQGPGSGHWLNGLELLYNMFQNDLKKDKLETIYGYTLKQYNADKQKYDVFNMISDNQYIKTTLYFDKGNGYNEKDCISNRFYISSNHCCHIEFALHKSVIENVKKIRIDLDEGRYYSFYIKSVKIDEKELCLCPINGQKKSDGWDVFYTSDPQYELSNYTSGKLEIDIETMEIRSDDLDNYFENIKRENSLLQADNIDLIKEITTIKESKWYKFYCKIKSVL